MDNEELVCAPWECGDQPGPPTPKAKGRRHSTPFCSLGGLLDPAVGTGSPCPLRAPALVAGTHPPATHCRTDHRCGMRMCREQKKEGVSVSQGGDHPVFTGEARLSTTMGNPCKGYEPRRRVSQSARQQSWSRRSRGHRACSGTLGEARTWRPAEVKLPQVTAGFSPKKSSCSWGGGNGGGKAGQPDQKKEPQAQPSPTPHRQQ